MVTAATATAAQLDVAARALAAAEDLLGPTTYARVDMVETEERGPAVLELELLDPVLFLTHHPDGAAAATPWRASLPGSSAPPALHRPEQHRRQRERQRRARSPLKA